MNKIPPHAKKVFEGVIFDVYQWEQTLFDGTTDIFEVLKRRDGTNIIARTIDGQFLLIDELQPTWKQMHTGLPAGSKEPGDENILETAQRELREETGYVSEHWKEWFAVSPASKIEWNIHVFIADHARKEHEPTLDPGERITTRLVSPEQFIEEACADTFRITEVTQALYRLRAENRLHEFFALFNEESTPPTSQQ